MTAGAFAYVNAVAAGQIGTWYQTGAINFSEKVLLHGMLGGVMNVLAGGKFGHGFSSAAVLQTSGEWIKGIGNGAAEYRTERIIVAALVGGTVSAATGGKFANGAITAVFSWAYNDEGEHGDNVEPEVELERPATLNGYKIRDRAKAAMKKLRKAVQMVRTDEIASKGHSNLDPDDLYRLKLTVRPGFSPNQKHGCCSRAEYEGEGRVSLWSGGIEKTGISETEIAHTIAHEWRHSMQTWYSSQRIEYENRATEKDANAFADSIMKYYGK